MAPKRNFYKRWSGLSTEINSIPTGWLRETDMYYTTDTQKEYVWLNEQWVDVSGGAGAAGTSGSSGSSGASGSSGSSGVSGTSGTSAPVDTNNYWTDLVVPLTQAQKGPNDKPDFDYTNVGYLFPYNDQTETLSIITQMPHGYFEGSTIRPHIHWTQSNATAPIWVLQYKFYNNGDAVPGWTTVESTTHVFTYTSGTIGQITRFPEIIGTGMKISAMFKGILYRKGSTGINADILADQFDIHYQIDDPGSIIEYSKSGN